MCVSKTHCLCHLLKKIIEADVDMTLREKYFVPTQRVELYDFLKLAYSLLKEDSMLLNNPDFDLLNGVYIAKGGEDSLNLTDEDYKRYKGVLDSFKEHDVVDPELVRAEIRRIVKKMEQLLYLNVSFSQPEFVQYIMKSIEGPGEMMHSIENSEDKKKQMCFCTIF